MQVKEVHDKDYRMWIVVDDMVKGRLIIIMEEGELSFWNEIEPDSLQLIDMGISEQEHKEIKKRGG